MPLINKIDQMKKEGLDDGQISQRLREEGASPREIDEAFDQSQVKSVVGTYEDIPTGTSPSREFPRENPQEFASQTVDYPQYPQPISGQEANGQFEEQTLLEVPQQAEQPEGNYPQQGQYQQPEQYSQQGQEQYPQYQYPQENPVDTEVITELVEQIISEKTGDIQKALSDFSKFKIEIQGKVEDMNERLRRIEMTIDRLQASIIGQIGNYGRNISDLKKEMIMTQESFSKVLNPLSDHLQELRKIAAGTPKAAEKSANSTNSAPRNSAADAAKKDSFRHYVR